MQKRVFRFSTMTAILTLLVSADVCRADIYKYVDAAGVVHFTDNPTHGRYRLYLKEKRGRPGVEEIVRRYADINRLDEALVRAVIRAESNYDPRAVSRKGAMGMMQLMPETAKDLQVGDPFDPEQNIRGGTRYLRLMLDQFDGDLELALAAYNAGPGAVRKYGGIPPYNETRTYVRRVKEYLLRFRQDEDSLL